MRGNVAAQSSPATERGGKSSCRCPEYHSDVSTTWYRRRWGRVGLVVTGVLLAAALVARWALHRYTDERRVARQIAAALALPSDTLVRIASTRFSVFGRSFTARDLRITIDSVAGGRRIRYALGVDTVRLDGIDLRAWLRGAVLVSTVTADGLSLDVRLDRRHGGGRPGGEVRLLHSVLQRLPQPVRLDTVRVRGGAVRYEETAADGVRPGVLVLDRIAATAVNLTNDRHRMTDSTRAVIDVRMRIAEAGTVTARLAYDLMAPELTIAYLGSVGRMPMAAFNPILVDLAGIRVTDGTLDTAWVAVDVLDNVARGRLTVRYHDLALEILDKATHERGLGDHVRTFIGANFVLQEANPAEPDGALREGALVRRRSPEVPLVRFIWETLREGIKETVGL